MADKTKIEWTEATWNPVTGCSIVSPGCAHCYAMKLAGTRLAHIPSRAGLTQASKNGPVWTGEVRFNEGWLLQPLQWKRPRMIFVCAHGDLFHESVPDEWIDKVFAVMALAPRHTFQVLTKRAERMRAYLGGPFTGDGVAARIAEATLALAPLRTQLPEPPVICEVPVGPRLENGEPEFGFRRLFHPKAWPLPNVWLGVSAERQQEADERIPHLLTTPAAVRWVSAEPLLGPINLDEVIPHPTAYSAVHGMTRLLDWIVVGGESGNGARPMHPDWARSLRDQCAGAGVSFFFKQWGGWSPTHPNWPNAASFALANDGTLYRSADLAYSDGKRHAQALRAGHDRAHLTSMYRLPKKAAGRALDGIEHNSMPERAA